MKLKTIDYFAIILIVMIILILGLTSGCKNEPSVNLPAELPEKAPTAKPVVAYDWKNHLWDTELNNAIYFEKLSELKPVDAAEFNLDPTKDEQWAKILVMMAKYESNWKPATTYQENFNDRFGNPIISSGLFQISIESSNGRGCKFKSQDELLHPIKNIRCAVKMFAYYVRQDQRIAGKVSGKWQGGAKYWAVLRGTTDHTAKALKAIKGANP